MELTPEEMVRKLCLDTALFFSGKQPREDEYFQVVRSAAHKNWILCIGTTRIILPNVKEAKNAVEALRLVNENMQQRMWQLAQKLRGNWALPPDTRMEIARDHAARCWLLSCLDWVTWSKSIAPFSVASAYSALCRAERDGVPPGETFFSQHVEPDPDALLCRGLLPELPDPIPREKRAQPVPSEKELAPSAVAKAPIFKPSIVIYCDNGEN